MHFGLCADRALALPPCGVLHGEELRKRLRPHEFSIGQLGVNIAFLDQRTVAKNFQAAKMFVGTKDLSVRSAADAVQRAGGALHGGGGVGLRR